MLFVRGFGRAIHLLFYNSDRHTPTEVSNRCRIELRHHWEPSQTLHLLSKIWGESFGQNSSRRNPNAPLIDACAASKTMWEGCHAHGFAWACLRAGNHGHSEQWPWHPKFIGSAAINKCCRAYAALRSLPVGLKPDLHRQPKRLRQIAVEPLPNRDSLRRNLGIPATTNHKRSSSGS